METNINLGLLLKKALGMWYFYAIIFPAAVGLAYVYAKSKQPLYEAEATLLINAEGKSGQMSEELVFDDLGLGKKTKSLENEVLILQSTPVVEKVIENLKLQYAFGTTGFMNRRELYQNSPVQVVNWEPNNAHSFVEGLFYIEEGGNFRIVLDKTKQEIKGEFGKEVRLPQGRLLLSRTRWENPGNPLSIVVLPLRARAGQVSENLSVKAMGELSSTLRLSYKDVSPERAEAVLTDMINVYNQQSIVEKNKIYENSLNLLNERIRLIAEELADAELDVSTYKQRFNMLELNAEGNMLLQELAGFNRELSSTDVQIEILSSVEDFLEKNKEKFEFVPNNLNISNLTLTTQLNNFNDMLKERETLRSRLGPAHPDLLLIEKQIKNLRQTIIDNIRSIKSDVQIGQRAKQDLSTSLENRIQSLPRRERELVEIERRKSIKENLYLYLLQKREQAAISLAITSATGRVIEPAAAVPKPVSPNKAQLYLIALFLGLAIPSGLVLLFYSINGTIQTEDDLERATTLQSAGMLALSPRKEPVVVKENANSAAAEMFHLLCANLAYLTPGKELKTLLVTSSISGEGKSYIALNLGISQALSGKKVVLLELDLRKPKKMTGGPDAKKGIVDFLGNKGVKADQIIENSGLHRNFDIITCGPKPTNPGELMLSGRLRELLDILKEEYDFIIIDTPPVGLVADALLLKDVADASMYVVRTGFTLKSHLKIIRNIAQKDKLPRPFLVLNGVKLKETVYKKGYAGYYNYQN